ncbi:MAG: 50S ribosomal protein L10 [Dehalococcoidales bacterium]|jgi:large subunit ribosomal protein L10|nr:50S ribosomal protein L10 [Dehalococcoidales bacterium]
MSKEKKGQIIDNLEEAFSRSTVGVLTDYRGLATPQLTALRRKLQESEAEYRVVKNTLARLAAERSGKEELSGSLEGPIGIAFGYGEITEPAKAIASYTRESRVKLDVKGGFLGDRLLTPQEVTTLSTLPSRDVLLGRVLGQMNAPISALASVLAGPIRGIMGVLQARIKQMEGE